MIERGKVVEMTYTEFINNILETRGRFACGEEYHERHHIKPKCMGGTNDEDNLIDLFAREHFEAHRLLALENPDVPGLTYAWWCMSVQTNQYTKERYQVTAEEYEEARIMHSINVSKNQSGINHPNYGNHKLAGEANPFYGKTHSDEARRKISEKAKGRSRPKDAVLKTAEQNKGKKRSEETKRKIGEAKKGKKRPDLSERNRESGTPIMCIETGIIYYGQREASRQTNISQSSIWKCLHNKQKTAGGFIWCYADEENQKFEGENSYEIQSNMSEDGQN